MKIISMIFLMFLTLVPSKQAVNDFSEKVHNAYSSYTVIYGVDEEEQSNNYFTIKVIQGINDGEVTYGVVLFNEIANSHELVIRVNDKEYFPKPNSRGDYLIESIKLIGDAQIHVVDEAGNSRKQIDVDYMTVDEFKNSELTKVEGLGNGIEIVKLGTSKGINSLVLLTLVFAGVCLVFGLIILFMIIGKKGMFNKEKRQDGVLNFREFIESIQSQNPIEVENEVVFNNRVEEEQTEAPIINMYPQIREYDDEIEVDVTSMVREKGYNTDYQNLSEQEKNEIMLYLMQLRDFKDITSEAYQKEVVKLWRK